MVLCTQMDIQIIRKEPGRTRSKDSSFWSVERLSSSPRAITTVYIQHCTLCYFGPHCLSQSCHSEHKQLRSTHNRHIQALIAKLISSLPHGQLRSTGDSQVGGHMYVHTYYNVLCTKNTIWSTYSVQSRCYMSSCSVQDYPRIIPCIQAAS